MVHTPIKFEDFLFRLELTVAVIARVHAPSEKSEENSFEAKPQLGLNFKFTHKRTSLPKCLQKLSLIIFGISNYTFGCWRINVLKT